MNVEQLKRGRELKVLIEQTEEALNSLAKFQTKTRLDGKFYEDGIYNLSISEHSDGSGKRADLCRYCGNEKLLKVIVEELEIQLKDFYDKFETL